MDIQYSLFVMKPFTRVAFHVNTSYHYTLDISSFVF